VRLAFPPT